ncbi:MAG: helicase-related protein, partial [candidate division SR1 bacterium]|nr:helicase-related protein [candidate division SR1 bacterium]
TIYGKQSYTIQMDALRRGVDIVVGTPGRIMDHLDRGTLKIQELKYFILDEADEMLDMGFEDDIQKIFKQTNDKKKVLLFSATMARNILNIAKKYIGEYDLVSVKSEQSTVASTDQSFLEVQEKDKFEALRRIIDMAQDFYGIVFCHTKADVDLLVTKLIDKGINAEGLHGDLQQKQRERVLKMFKDKKVTTLVATDVAARGIDVDDVTHVINYSMPQNAERYIHRVGRTGRAGKAGIAITFISPREYRQMSTIKAITKTDIKKGVMPKVTDIIESKKNNLKTDLQGTISGEKFKDYLDIADFLLTEADPREVIAGLLKINYEHDFSQNTYSEISSVGPGSSSGQSRLFIAVGKTLGYDPRSLLALIEKESGVPGTEINDMRIMDDFSFISTATSNAEKIIDAFVLKVFHGKKAIVSRAKEEGRSGGGNRFGGGRSYGSRPYGERKPFGERKPYGERKSFGDRPAYGDRPARPGGKPASDRKPWGDKPTFGDKKPGGTTRPYGDKPVYGDRPARPGGKPAGDKSRTSSFSGGSSARPSRPSSAPRRPRPDW